MSLICLLSYVLPKFNIDTYDCAHKLQCNIEAQLSRGPCKGIAKCKLYACERGFKVRQFHVMNIAT